MYVNFRGKTQNGGGLHRKQKPQGRFMLAASGTFLILMGLYGFLALRLAGGLLITLMALGIFLILAQCLKAFGVRLDLPRNEQSRFGAAPSLNLRGGGHDHPVDNLTPARDRRISDLAL